MKLVCIHLIRDNTHSGLDETD
jgi:hypothetical protein